jgi:hypothetical protein
MDDTVTFNAREQNGLVVLTRIGKGRLGAGTASQRLGLSSL